MSRFFFSLGLLAATFFMFSNLSFGQSEILKIEKIAPNTYRHISYLQTDSFGKVECNGMVVVSNGEAIVIDTPVDDASSKELIEYVEEELKSKIIAVIPTHFHEDCTGGLLEFQASWIPSYANIMTHNLAASHQLPIPQERFDKTKTFHVGGEELLVEFFGEGHTIDNVVAYFPKDQVLFGGCMIKAKGASEGFLGDANVEAWPVTVAKVKERFPDLKLVVPGHGQAGGVELLDYTIQLFAKEN
ncbi:subclass B1 metallo-beta-lactamase [Algoriphagus zhangzhouensis]|uniref:beta-lactamase n=1 Tax=Algoriphagus zhangzhouensis TaxID=1073327 RepID=A0A1M7ZI46_9BACT|nr:subclass B1 metallo-beta-lactamase [Algoriphagus zhangzhouensis]TDY44314.1 metallo-beta-lactamase class B [Algoriphagus zhangzhouensis]SHO64544.1 metallo-beta-lactamase class B [Algoriphagus zhangzhouensis]